jgi:hypothetical protein
MHPLSRTFRRNLFWVLVVVFIVGTPILIGYSKGYRLDDALLIIETGGVYLHAEVPNSTVYIDGEFIEESGTFFKNTLVQDLRPNKQYEVWVEKDGYQSWTKVLPVYPNLVTEARVMMLPEEFVWRSITASTTVFVTATSTKPEVDEDATSTPTTVPNPEYENLTAFFAEDRDQFAVEVATSTYVTIRGKKVATTTTIIEFQFPDWFSDFASTTVLAQQRMVRERDGIVAWLNESGDVYATWGKQLEPAPFYFCTATCTDMLVIDWAEPITRYEFYPNRNDVVIIGTERGVYAVELDARSPRNIQPFKEGAGLSFRVMNDGALVIFDGTEFTETSW